MQKIILIRILVNIYFLPSTPPTLGDEVFGGFGMELVEGRLLRRVILIQPLLQCDAESPSDDRVGREVFAPKVRPSGRATVVQGELLHGVPDRVLRPAVEGQLVGNLM